MNDENGFPGSLPDMNETTITVLSPIPGQVFSPGDTVSVRLAPKDGATIQSAIFGANGIDGCLLMSAIETPPYTVDFVIPETTVGNIIVTVMAFDTEHNISSAFFNITANTNAVVRTVVLAPTAGDGQVVTLAGIGETQEFLVRGLYSDGVTRDVTQYQTEYSTSDPSVATVSDAGLVTAVGNGYTYITAANGGEIDRLPVVVEIEAPRYVRISPVVGARPGETISLQIYGQNFGGLTKVELLSRSGQLDPNVVVSDLTIVSVNVVTINVAIAENCPSDQYAVVVTSAGGTSEALYTDCDSTFTVLPPTNILVAKPTRCNGHDILEGMVVLSDPAPNEGVTVIISSSNPAVTVPESVFIYPGQIFNTFEIWPDPVQADAEVTITATCDGVDATVTLTTLPLTIV
ncbi:MAG: hypothetical protein JWQ02_4623 [Capsulimonas sp.]|nr:hypothetical protein [Capsulimonas sp.]